MTVLLQDVLSKRGREGIMHEADEGSCGDGDEKQCAKFGFLQRRMESRNEQVKIEMPLHQQRTEYLGEGKGETGMGGR